jgi:hypothetical protein
VIYVFRKEGSDLECPEKVTSVQEELIAAFIAYHQGTTWVPGFIEVWYRVSYGLDGIA